MKHTIVTITGPSLSGKSTLESMLVKEGLAVKVCSTTTRKPRQGEVEGVDYSFVAIQTFEDLIKNDQMVEHIHFDGNYYGVSKDEVERKFNGGKVVAIVVEPNGAKQIKEFADAQKWDCLQVFVSNPEDVLKARFDARFNSDALADPAVYANRWNQMKTTEKQWREQMAGADLFFNRFDNTNQGEVLATLKEKVLSLTSENDQPKKRKP